MRKLLLSLIAVLLMGGVCFGQLAYDPMSGLSQEVMPVYNNSGGTLDAGDIVVWDIDASTGDNDAYVTTTTTAETRIVAGVIYPSNIAAGDRGSMVVYGFATCDIQTMVGENGNICTSTTAGSGKACSGGAEDARVGFCTAAASSNTCNCFVTAK